MAKKKRRVPPLDDESAKVIEIRGKLARYAATDKLVDEISGMFDVVEAIKGEIDSKQEPRTWLLFDLIQELGIMILANRHSIDELRGKLP